MSERKHPTFSLFRMLVTLVIVSGVFLLSAVSVYADPIGYRDSDGKWKVLDPKKLPKVPMSRLQTAGAVIRPSATKIAFTITFLDRVNSTGKGFDDPVEGQARRDTVSAVVAYIDTVLNHSGGGCEIEFGESLNTGTGSLAWGGPRFFLVNGYTPGLPFQHITTGVDPYPPNPPDDPIASDMKVTFDFGYGWYAGTDPVPFDKLDLYSVLLHEITHGLGIVSLTQADGTSPYAGAPNYRKTFVTFENLLYTGNGNKLWDSGGNFNGIASWLVGGDGGIRFHGTNAMATFGSYPPIYAPNPWQDGSSIAHWNTGIIPTPVMNYNIGSGTARRTYQPFEVGALKDLGYTVSTPEPDIQVTPAALNFGEWYWDAGTTGPLTLLIENKGAGQLEFTGAGIQIVGANPGDFEINPSAATTPLAPAASRTLYVYFNPTESFPKSAILRITTNDPDTAIVNVPLTGKGIGRMPAAVRSHWMLYE